MFSPVQEAVIEFVRREGDDAMRKSILELRKACCGLRKMEPLRACWPAAAPGSPACAASSPARAPRSPSTKTMAKGRKLSPIADWTWAEVWAYVEKFKVPYNPLHDEFMPHPAGCALHPRHRRG